MSVYFWVLLKRKHINNQIVRTGIVTNKETIMLTEQEVAKVNALTLAKLEEIKECHPEGKVECYCDNGHAQAETVCMYCYHTQ